MGLFYGFTLYSYAISWITVPIILVCLLVCFIYFRIGDLKKYIAAAIPLGILAIPLLIFNIINIFNLPTVQLFNVITIPYMQNYRGNEVRFHSPIKSLCRAFVISFTRDEFHYNSHPFSTTMYFISIVFVILGCVISVLKLVRGIKKKEFPLESIAVFVLIGTIAFVMSNSSVNLNRINGIFCSYLLFVVIAIRYFYYRIKGILVQKIMIGKGEKLIDRLSMIPIIAIILIYTICFVRFCGLYFNSTSGYTYFEYRIDYPLEKLKLEEQPGQYYIDVYYLYYLLAARMDPRTLNLEVDEEVEQIYNLHFATINSNLNTCLDQYRGYIVYPDKVNKITNIENTTRFDEYVYVERKTQ